jgi:excisionase family DNA binding protein
VIVPQRVAAWLERHAQLGRLRIDVRGADAEVDNVLTALRLAAMAWRDSACGTDARNLTEVEPLSVLSTVQAAGELGITDRAVRLAIQEGRLTGQQVSGRWQISREDLEHYRAARAA